jgi:hypothetical protein
MQTPKSNQKDDSRKQNTKDVSGQSKNQVSKNEAGLKKDQQDDDSRDRKSITPKTPSKSSQSTKDR